MKINRCACGRITEGRERPINDLTPPTCSDCRMFGARPAASQPQREFVGVPVLGMAERDSLAGLFARSFR